MCPQNKTKIFFGFNGNFLKIDENKIPNVEKNAMRKMDNNENKRRRIRARRRRKKLNTNS